MNRLDSELNEQVKTINKRLMRLLILVVIVIGSIIYTMGSTTTALWMNYDPSMYFKVAPFLLLAGLIALLLNERSSKSLWWLSGTLGVFFVTASHLIFVYIYQFEPLSYLPYILAFLLVAVLLHHKTEQLFSALLSQILLVYMVGNYGPGIQTAPFHLVGTSLVILMICLLGYLKTTSTLKAWKAEDQTSQLKTLQDGILNSEEVLMAVLSPEGVVLNISEGMIKTLGANKSMDSPLDYMSLMGHESGGVLNEAFTRTVDGKIKSTVESINIKTTIGSPVTLRIVLEPIQNPSGLFILLVATEITREIQMKRVKDMMVRLNKEMIDYLSVEVYYDHVLRNLVNLMPSVDYGSFEWVDDAGIMKASTNYGDKVLGDIEEGASYTESLFYKHCGAEFKQPLIINDLKTQQTDLNGEWILDDSLLANCSALSGPIYMSGQFKGLITLESSQNNVFNSNDLEIIRFLVDQVELVLKTDQQIEQSLYLSKFDQLTGLFNKWQLNEFERNTLPRSKRYKERFALVLMDLNHLKEVNDRYGYQMGDMYLIEFAALLKKHSRETDIVYRIGGNKFVSIYFTIDGFTMNGKMEILEQELKRNMVRSGIEDIECYFAYGFAEFPDEGQSVPSLLEIAEQRLIAKKNEMMNDVRYL